MIQIGITGKRRKWKRVKNNNLQGFNIHTFKGGIFINPKFLRYFRGIGISNL